MPRRYSFDVDLDQIYQAKTNGKQRVAISYREHAEAYYVDAKLDQYVKLIRDQVKSNIEEEKNYTKSFNMYKKNQMENNGDCDRKETNNSQFVCKLKLKNDIKERNNTIAKHEWHSPPKSIFKPFVEALQEFNMIQNGDKILVCLSGGKDSMSLLHAIRQYQFVARSKVKFKKFQYTYIKYIFFFKLKRM